MKAGLKFLLSPTSKVVLTLLLVACAAAFGTSKSFYAQALVDAFFAFALASVVILHLRVRCEGLEIFFLVTGALLLAVVDFRFRHYPPYLMAGFSFLGLSSFAVMAVVAIWTENPDSARTLLRVWVPAALFVASDYFASTMLEWTGAAHPKTLDGYLLSFDYSLRVPLVFIAGQIYQLRPWLHNASLLAYVGLAIPIAVVYGGRLVRYKERAFPAMLAFLVTGPVGILFYNIFPACGPHSLFRANFPFHVLPIDQVPRLILEPIAIDGPRNAIPSLHLTWVLLAWWYSRGLSWIERLIALIFLVLTVFATLGTGEHWFVDLVVAVPFALFIQALSAYRISWRDTRRWSALAFGLLCTLGWFFMLRYAAQFFWTSPIVPWGLLAATIALTTIRQLKLDECNRLLESAAAVPAAEVSVAPVSAD
jgi:PAP2 superfamily